MAKNIGQGSWQEHQKEVADKLQNMSSDGTTFTGAATEVTVEAQTSGTGSVLFTTSATGDLEPKSHAALTYQPATSSLATVNVVCTAVDADVSVTCGSLVIDGTVLSFASIPTSDPEVAGQLWSDSGTVKVSAGA